MRIDVKKFVFVGAVQDKRSFFKEAQQAGIIHFIDVSAATKGKELPAEIHQTMTALKVLRGLPSADYQEARIEQFDARVIVGEILTLNQQREKMLEEMRLIRLEIARIGPFGQFSLDDIASIEKEGHRKVQFFVAKKGVFHEQPLPEELFYINSDHGLDYYLAINVGSVSYPKMTEIKIEHSLGTLKKRYHQAEQESHAIEHHLKEYAKYNELLHHALIEQLNKYHLFSTEEYVQQVMEGELFAVEGWVPINKMEELKEVVQHHLVHVEEIAVEPTDAMPTYLENKGFSRIGEDLVGIYDTPSVQDKDPSPWVLVCFALFFSIIIGDAGYGLLYLALALFLRYKFPNLKGVKKRILNLFLILSTGCVVWGLLTTTFFGMGVEPDNPLKKLSIVHWLAEKKADYHLAHQDAVYQDWVKKHPDLQEAQTGAEFLTYSIQEASGGVKRPVLDRFYDSIMMELALFIGVVHVSLSLLRYAGRNWVNWGWFSLLIGGYLYLPYYLGAPSFLNFVGGIDLAKGAQVGLWMMGGGVAFAVIGSVIQDGFTGVFSFMRVIEIFSDILSYLRLYALGLSGAIVSTTINEIAGSIPAIFAVLLVMIGHGINIVLGTMSGVIHGLRLNFLEWYHYSFEGGGKQFTPLKIMKME